MSCLDLVSERSLHDKQTKSYLSVPSEDAKTRMIRLFALQLVPITVVFGYQTPQRLLYKYL